MSVGKALQTQAGWMAVGASMALINVLFSGSSRVMDEFHRAAHLT